VSERQSAPILVDEIQRVIPKRDSRDDDDRTGYLEKQFFV
jgi:hypothetical protein